MPQAPSPRSPRSPRALRLLGMLVALACLPAARCASVQRPYKAPDAKTVLQALQRRAAAVRSLRAEARMSYQTHQGKVKATVRMMAQTGGKLRFDVVSPFDTPLATLVTEGGQFSLVDAQKNRHFHGPASPCNLSRLLRVQLRPEDVLTVLGGATPLITHDRKSLRWDDRAGSEVLTLHGKTSTQLLRLDGRDRGWRLQSSEIRDNKGKLLLRLTADGYKRRGGVEVPTQMKVEQPTQKAVLALEFKRQEINIELPKIAFERPSAKSMPSQQVDCATTLRVDR